MGYLETHGLFVLVSVLALSDWFASTISVVPIKTLTTVIITL
jgi:hypothetical protein